MDHNTLVALNVGLRCFASAVALGGAAFLAYHGKEGWGWLIFAGIILGGITVGSK
ncbi:MAG: hypothetical protein JRC86_05500 [Deltaproteobacteria bacterium]|nr:hypothetical protein [Deltaproteobacteria bacterium]